jgi:hypothetical protein
MDSRVKTMRAAAALCVAALLLTGGPGPAGAEVKNRALASALGRGFSDADAAQIERGFRAALQADVREGDAADMVENCVKGGFSSPQVQRALSLLTQLSLEHLPTAGFAAKIEEGVAKRVQPDRVLQVAERRALMLKRAKALVNGLVLDGYALDDRDELLPDIAGALEAGSGEDELRRLMTGILQEGGGVGDIRRKLFP